MSDVKDRLLWIAGQYLEAYRQCYTLQLNLPCLALAYTIMDIMASLDRPKDHPEVTGQDFQQWASAYLAPETAIGCTPLDLWGARCGLLHACEAESRVTKTRDLSKRGTPLVYVRLKSSKQDLQQKLDKAGHKMKAVQMEDLLDAVASGIGRFTAAVLLDKEKCCLVASRLPDLFGYVPVGNSNLSAGQGATTAPTPSA